MGNTIIIEKYHTNYEKFLWVISARRHEETSHNLHLVCIKKNRVVCTDGNRLHLFRHDREYKPGLYEVKAKDKKTIILQRLEDKEVYPNIVKVVPRRFVKKISIKETKDMTRGANYTHVVRQMDEEETLDLNYYEDCVTEGEWLVKFSDSGGPVYFKNKDRTALIMPAKLDRNYFSFLFEKK